MATQCSLLVCTADNKVLVVGCDGLLERKIQNAFKPVFDEEKSHVSVDYRCIHTEHFIQLDPTLTSFDLVIINQGKLKVSLAELQPLFVHSLSFIQNGSMGNVLINGMLPDFENHKKDIDWLGADAYQLIILMRSMRDHDAALSFYEGGLLLVHPRTNPYRILQHELTALNMTYAYFRKNMDKVVPVLSFAEMHEWLSNAAYTQRFVRSLLEKVK